MQSPIDCGRSLDELAIERLLRDCGCPGPSQPPLVFDLRGAEFVDPHGLVGLLEIGRWVTEIRSSAHLLLPQSAEVLSYMSRIDFFAHAMPFFTLGASPPPPAPRKSRSDVLLEVTPIRASADIHAIVGKVRLRAQTILTRHLRRAPREVERFIVALSEVCQNILEHSGEDGIVAIQKYFYRASLGRNVVKLAVSDLGVGMRESLGTRLADRFGPAWCDSEAIRQGLFHNVSRHDDPGRGNGLRAVRTLVERWGGKVVIRSGTAKVGIVPPWAYGLPQEDDLPFFPGTQVWITLPEVERG